MCGIFGAIGHISIDLANRCIDTMAHRGPNGRGFWQGQGATLGHRRLSILDLSEGGRQPMSYARERYWITYNGEIYNFLEIRRDLEALGHIFQSESDTEVVVAAFVQWGEQCLSRFNGMWALAIWDSHEKALFMARDRLGEKPLFYSTSDTGAFIFASEMKALFPLLKTVTPDPRLFGQQQMFRYEATSACIVREIKRFPAGHAGWLRDGRLSIKRWWNTLDHLVAVPSRYEEQVEHFRELFQDACRLRMRSDVSVGTALSGGLDSSATIATMARLSCTAGAERRSADWQHAFVASFPGTPLDESRYAKAVADHLSVPATFIEVDPLKSIDRLDEDFYTFEDFYITSPIPFMQTYAAVRAHGVTVTLDGHGADELFGGYSGDYLLSLKDAGFDLRQAFGILDTYYESYPPDTLQFQPLPPKWIYLAKFHLRNLSRRLFRPQNVITSRDSDHPAWAALGAMDRQLYISTHETILPTLLRNYDRYSMANGVEIRMPFLDHRILSFAFSIPFTSKIRGGYSKALVREAVAPWLPDEVVWRKTKLGFNSPIVDWLKGPLRNYVEDVLESSDFKACPLIAPAKVTQLVRSIIQNPSSRFHEGEQAWTQLSPYFWWRAMQRNVDNLTAPDISAEISRSAAIR
jgi:asparagine synthase (glutamine-hydrolysing)